MTARRLRRFVAIVFLALARLAVPPQPFAGPLRVHSKGNNVHAAAGGHPRAVGRQADRHVQRVLNVWEPGYQQRFYDLATAEAAEQKVTTKEHLEAIENKAREWLDSDVLLDREDFQNALAAAIREKGQLTLVLGGKSTGKSLVTRKTIQKIQEDPKVLVLSVDMRKRPSMSLFEAILTVANATLPQLDISWAPGLLSGLSATLALFMPQTVSMTAPLAEAARGLVRAFPTQAQKTLDDIIAELNQTQRLAALVVDEANVALPSPEGQTSEREEALPYLVGLTKQNRQASVVLISSDLAYPYRLQQGGLNLFDIGKVIVAGEVPKDDMMRLFTETWGTGQGLAEEFYAYYGGHVFAAYQALLLLIKQREKFQPFGVITTPGLANCIEDRAAVGHLINMCLRGYSYVKNIKKDKGAKLIAKEDIGGVISVRAETFGLPDMWNGTTYEFAVVPASSHMRLKICRDLAAAGRLQMPGPFSWARSILRRWRVKP